MRFEMKLEHKKVSVACHDDAGKGCDQFVCLAVDDSTKLTIITIDPEYAEAIAHALLTAAELAREARDAALEEEVNA